MKSDKCSQGILKLGEDYGEGRFARATMQIFASVEEKAMIRLHVIVKNYNACALVFDSRILKMSLKLIYYGKGELLRRQGNPLKQDDE